jgi:hypothetical protein
VLLSAALAAGILLSLSACQMPLPREQDLIGTWRHHGTAAAVVLSDDRSCHVTNLPAGAILRDSVDDGGPLAGPLIDSRCTWKLGDDSDDLRGSRGDPIVTLYFARNSTAPASGLTMFLSGTGRSKTLFWVLGDPDSDRRYELTASASS